MAKDIAIITLHGMGEYKPDYYEDLQKILRKKLGDSWDKVAFEPVQYQPILQNNQNSIWQRMNQFPLDGSKIRRFLLFGLSDAGSLEYSARQNEADQYIKVQKEIIRALDQGLIQLENHEKPIIIVAQSLGCQVISNYIWDSKNNLGVFKDQEPNGTEQEKKFRRLKSCIHLFTTGCNIPLFLAGLKPIQAIEKPSDGFTWDNFYDRDDVLGWPLSPLSESYEALVNDHEINSGSFFSHWNPLSHNKYWTDKDVYRPLLARINSIIS